MSEPKRIAVTTFGRSDFSILRPLCRALFDDARFDMGLWVGGAHFEELSGRTVDEVVATGLPIWASIDMGVADRSPIGTARAMAAQLTGFADAAAAASPAPDVVVVLGDRYEAVAAGLAMVPLGVPVAHISGGSVTEGAIDDTFRHCLTKIAAVHFCETPRFARRIQHMGEAPDRIFTTGALGLDAFVDASIAPLPEFVERFGFTGLRPGYALVTVHPESRHLAVTSAMTRATIASVRACGLQSIVTYPNADPGADEVVAAIEDAASTDADVHVVRAFGPDWYPTAMAHAGLMVGNSSGGIIEAASFGLPVVDVGDRQKGRDCGPNVLRVGRDQLSIERAIQRALSSDFIARARSGNLYGDGRAAERIVLALGRLDLDDLRCAKPFVDAVPDFVGELMELP